jgi:hypothetical protein
MVVVISKYSEITLVLFMRHPNIPASNQGVSYFQNSESPSPLLLSQQFVNARHTLCIPEDSDLGTSLEDECATFLQNIRIC